MKSFFENLWYHHKAIIIIIAAVLICGIYLGIQTFGTPDPDYSVAIVSPKYYPDETLADLEAALRTAGTDRNGDGEVTVRLASFHVALGEDGQDFNEIGALDADLSGKVSGLYLTADPEAFEAATNSIIAAGEFVPSSSFSAIGGPCPEELFAAVRKDHPEADEYAMLLH